MRASIVVVSYNSRAYLGACLASLQSAAGPDDELIVVDNGSTDGSADLVVQQFPGVRLLRATNAGYAGGNNCGAAA
jgi:GT2 family glycosyltransferase